MGEYMTQMPDVGVTPEEARALWEPVRCASSASDTSGQAPARETTTEGRER